MDVARWNTRPSSASPAEDGTRVQFEAGKMKALEMVAAINKKARTM